MPVAENWRLVRVLEYVQRDLTKRPSLKEIARVAALERTYFCRYFQRECGVCFSAWHKRVRIEHAKQLLVSTAMPVSAIGAAIGYSDPTTFGRIFRKETKASPRQYRAQQRASGRNTTHVENSTMDAEKRVD
jgi:AraC-like DNA-binding protein